MVLVTFQYFLLCDFLFSQQLCELAWAYGNIQMFKCLR